MTKAYNLPAINEIKLSYIAGIFDGEGSIYISTLKSHGKDALRMQISVGNTDRNMIDFLSKTFMVGKVKSQTT